MVRLRFIGTDGSMGLRHGQIYNVVLKTDGKYFWIIIHRFEGPNETFRTLRCPYSSTKAFANNWDIVSVGQWGVQ